MGLWEVKFFRSFGENPVATELRGLREHDPVLAEEVVQDLAELEEYGLSLPRKLRKIRGSELWELRTRWERRIARSIFFKHEKRLLVVTTIYQKKSQAIPDRILRRAEDRMRRWKRVRQA